MFCIGSLDYEITIYQVTAPTSKTMQPSKICTKYIQAVAEGTRRKLGDECSDVSLGLQSLHYNSCSRKQVLLLTFVLKYIKEALQRWYKFSPHVNFVKVHDRVSRLLLPKTYLYEAVCVSPVWAIVGAVCQILVGNQTIGHKATLKKLSDFSNVWADRVIFGSTVHSRFSDTFGLHKNCH